MFELPALPYDFAALEPHIDARTMEIHHGKHHQAYVNNLNNAVKGNDAEGKSLEELIGNISKYSMAIRNNGGGHWNHTFFWSIMSPTPGGSPDSALAKAIHATWGTFAEFQKQFTEAALNRFGSGWAWLVLDHGTLAIVSTANQDTPLSEGKTPILGIDVWEHAYYLKHQAARAAYVAAWWNVVNWTEVERRYAAHAKR